MPDTMADNAARTKMPKAGLGRNGPVVSRLALGTMTFGAETDEAEAHRQLDTFVDHGGTLIDTADVYSAGASEEMIGRWGQRRGGLPGSPFGLVPSAMFGLSFFMAPTAVTSFAWKNLDQALWGRAVGMFTIVFASGQIGPISRASSL